MRLKLALLFTCLAVCLGLSAATAQAVTITMTPTGAPTYTGGNGTGNWTGTWRVCGGPCGNGGSQIYQVEAISILWVDGSSHRGNYPLDFRSDTNLSSTTAYYSTNYLDENTPSSCPYPGFHWFGFYVYWRSRQWVAGIGQWTAWTAYANTAVSSGVYGQACL